MAGFQNVICHDNHVNSWINKSVHSLNLSYTNGKAVWVCAPFFLKSTITFWVLLMLSSRMLFIDVVDFL